MATMTAHTNKGILFSIQDKGDVHTYWWNATDATAALITRSPHPETEQEGQAVSPPLYPGYPAPLGH